MMSIKNSMMSKRVSIKSVQLSQSNDKLINRIIDHQVKGVAKELLDWRNDLSIDAARDKCQDLTVDRYSIAIMATGGLGDTLAAIREGFQPIIGTEIQPIQQKMWEDLVGTKSAGDVRMLDITKLRKPTVYGAGMPCQSWSTAGYKAGENSIEGALYIWQADLILELSPEIFYLEQSPNVRQEPAFAASYMQLKKKLAVQYTLHEHDIKSWVYGDPQNRIRLYIVGVHNKHGKKAKQWKWPAHKYDAKRYPI